MSDEAKPVVTREQLLAEDLEWLLESTFLACLQPKDRDETLASMEWRDYAPKEVMIQYGAPGRGVELLVSGQVLILAPDEKGVLVPTARQGPGNVIGERSVHTGEQASAQVLATSAVRSLHMSASLFRRLIERSDSFRAHMEGLIALRARWRDLLEILLHNPVLRFLGRDDLGRLIQSGRLVHENPGATVMRAGEEGLEVYVVVRGRVAIYQMVAEGGPRQWVADLGPGALLGDAAVMLETTRTADVVAQEKTELLCLSGSAFLEIVVRNPQVQRHLMQKLAKMSIKDAERRATVSDGMVTFICSTEPRLGATTLAYGTAASLVEATEVTVVDLEGVESAKRLGLPIKDALFADVAVREVDAPLSWGVRVLWPADVQHMGKLINAFRVGARDSGGDPMLLISGQLSGPSAGAVLAEAESAVFVRRASDPMSDMPILRGQVRFQAIRVEKDGVLPIATSRKAVRVPRDPSNCARFWRRGEMALISGEQTPMGRASRRLARLLRGRSVGLALGGGGALGFAHVGLLRVLEQAQIPVDYISGVSFGSLVASLYVGGGMPALEELIRRRTEFFTRLLWGMAQPSAMSAFVDRLTGDRALGSTEIPFYPVGLDVASGREFIMAKGSLGDGMVSSSCLPGLFPPVRMGLRRIVDGGVVNNVPASVIWEAGADFIVGSNIIPTNPLGAHESGTQIPGSLVMRPVARRVDDLLRSMYMLMSQAGRDRASLADYVFNLDIQGYNIYDFSRGAEIADAGQAQAELLLPHIEYAYAHDASIRF